MRIVRHSGGNSIISNTMSFINYIPPDHGTKSKNTTQHRNIFLKKSFRMMDEKMTKWRWLFLGLVITHHMTDGLDENIWTRNNISEPELKIICHLPCCGAAGISLESRPFWKYLYLMPWQEMSPALVFEGMKPMQSKHITVKKWRKVLEFRHETLFTGLSV